MWAFLGRVFGTDKAAAAIIDNTSSALDKLFYTDEEKAEDRARSATEARSMIISWMAATSGQNLARRVLAFMITIAWLVQYIYVMVVGAVSPFVVIFVDSPEKVELITQVLDASSASVAKSADGMTGAIMLILGFYFAAPHLGDITKVAMTRFATTFKKEEKNNG